MATIEQGSSGNLTPILNGVNILPYSIVGNGQTTVTTAGTPVQLASNTATTSITIRAFASNSGKIYIGTVGVTSSTGFILSSDETVSIDLDNLDKIYLNSDNNGEGVSYIYLA